MYAPGWTPVILPACYRSGKRGTACDGASSSRCSAARRRRGRSRHAHSRARACGALVCSCREWRTIRNTRSASRRFCKGSANWAGSSAATCACWGAGDVERYRTIAAELIALSPDVVVAYGFATASALQKATRSVPIVFASVTDPVGGGLVASLARPGGNATGFVTSEFGFAGKWLELLKEVAPRVPRVGVLRNAAIASQIALFGSIQSVAPSFGVELRPIDTSDAGEIERAIAAFAREPNGGLIAASGAGVIMHRELIVTLAARHRLPAVYAYRGHVSSGGLISYSSDQVDNFRQAAGYVSRILKGKKPADLPVQAPTKYELVINLKTAKALGLEVPASMLARADGVIEQCEGGSK